jgi:hypothetical protein
MPGQNIFTMKVSKIYPLLLNKVERKGRTKAELDEVIAWLSGHEMEKVNPDMSYGAFLSSAPAWNERADRITGMVCGIRVETIQDPLTKRMRQLDKLVDELAKGKPLEKVMR